MERLCLFRTDLNTACEIITVEAEQLCKEVIADLVERAIAAKRNLGAEMDFRLYWDALDNRTFVRRLIESHPVGGTPKSLVAAILNSFKENRKEREE